MNQPTLDAPPLILVVDDEESVRESVRHLLEAHGYAARGAIDGQHALELLRGGLRPCLILLDLRMPRKDGFEFRAEQTKDARLASIPTVIVSSTEVHQEMGKLAGVLPKPVPLAELLALLAEYCPKLTDVCRTSSGTTTRSSRRRSKGT
jgi:CheY-like chemotaxis protein